MEKHFFSLKKSAWVLLIIIAAALSGCNWFGDKPSEDPTKLGTQGNSDELVANNAAKDQSILEYNLIERTKRATKRFPGDTLDLMKAIVQMSANEKGTYLVDVDPTTTYNWPRSAVLYYKGQDGAQYVFAVIAKSKQNDTILIEAKNVVGYDASFIDFDSTKQLGTPFFFLTLFKWDGSNFSKVWEVYTPSHGGFNNITLGQWANKKTPYIKLDFHYASGVGHIDYNYFLIRGITEIPHLLMTYEAVNAKRTMGDVNNDEYPDYFEFLYVDTGRQVNKIDSVGFIWRTKDSLYVNTRNPKQTRPY